MSIRRQSRVALQRTSQKDRTLSDLLEAKKGVGILVRCQTCRDERAAQFCKEFAALKKAGKTLQHMSWRWFRDNVLVEEYGIEIKATSILTHVRNCLGFRSTE